MIENASSLPNAFCVDLGEWFHVCGVTAEYSDPATWDAAPAHVVQDTEVLLQLLAETNSRATFLTMGWVADRYPELIERIVRAGHEIGCHSYFHRLVYAQTAAEFEQDLQRALTSLRRISGQPVSCYRAPGFSMRSDTLWAYPILVRHGISVDVSIVPARRDHGGLIGAARDPFLLNTSTGRIRCFPVSVMRLAGRLTPFSGGGYLRLFPQWLISAGFRQNHQDGRVGMCYIHPREINPSQPRLRLPRLKAFKYYVNLRATRAKLRRLLMDYSFTTVSETLNSVRAWPEYELQADSERGLLALKRRGR